MDILINLNIKLQKWIKSSYLTSWTSSLLIRSCFEKKHLDTWQVRWGGWLGGPHSCTSPRQRRFLAAGRTDVQIKYKYNQIYRNTNTSVNVRWMERSTSFLSTLPSTTTGSISPKDPAAQCPIRIRSSISHSSAALFPLFCFSCCCSQFLLLLSFLSSSPSPPSQDSSLQFPSSFSPLSLLLPLSLSSTTTLPPHS